MNADTRIRLLALEELAAPYRFKIGFGADGAWKERKEGRS